MADRRQPRAARRRRLDLDRSRHSRRTARRRCGVGSRAPRQPPAQPPQPQFSQPRRSPRRLTARAEPLSRGQHPPGSPRSALDPLSDADSQTEHRRHHSSWMLNRRSTKFGRLGPRPPSGMPAFKISSTNRNRLLGCSAASSLQIEPQRYQARSASGSAGIATMSGNSSSS